MSELIERAKVLRGEGKTFKEVAAEVGCSEGYLRKRLSGFKRSMDNSSDLKAELEVVQASIKRILGML